MTTRSENLVVGGAVSARPRLLDLFSGAGGAAVGYHRAGFEVVGVDIDPQPNYPFEFHQADALTFLADHGQEFDVIHASPPCQAYSTMTKGRHAPMVHRHPKMVPAVQQALDDLARPYIIENVPGSPLRDPITLCGEMFGLAVIRHRLFESNVDIPQPEHVPHRGRVCGWRHGKRHDGPYYGVYGNTEGTLQQWSDAMGIDWMTRKELAGAIPPAYTEYVGQRIMIPLTIAN